MDQILLNKPIKNEAVSKIPSAQMATPLLFTLRETPPEVKWLDLTDTGAPTDVPPREQWDMDYDS